MLNESIEQYKDLNAFEFLEEHPVEAAKYLVKTLRKIGHNVVVKNAQYFINNTIKGNIRDGLGGGNNRLVDYRSELSLDLPSANDNTSGPEYGLKGRHALIKVNYERYKISLVQSAEDFMMQLAEKVKEHYVLSHIPYKGRKVRKEKLPLIHRELGPLLKKYGFKLNGRSKERSYEIRIDSEFLGVDIEEAMDTAWYPYKEFAFEPQIKNLERIVGYLAKFFENRNTNLLRVNLSNDLLYIETGDEEPTKYVYDRFNEGIAKLKASNMYQAYGEGISLHELIILAVLDR